MNNPRHLVWIIFAALTGFFASFIFGDLLPLPVDLYYLIYFIAVVGLLSIYIRKTHLNLSEWVRRRAVWGVVLGLILGVFLAQNVLSRPATQQFTGAYLAWSIFWRGIVYGLVDGLLLTTFPWIVTWRAYDVERKSFGRKIGYGFLAWFFVIVITTAYHAGYADFRSGKLLQANIGNTIIFIPTVVTGNPIGSPLAHAIMHVTAVVHSPRTELFLPPHR